MMRRIRRPKKIVKSESSLKTREGDISFILARSSGRRTLTIVVDEEAQVSVASPFYMDEKTIHVFIHEKARWIVAKIREAQRNKDILSQREFAHGREFLFLGKRYRLNVIKSDVKRSRVAFDSAQGWSVLIPQGLLLKDTRKEIRRKMLQWYQHEAKEILGGRIFYYSRLMGVAPQRIAIRTQKRIWGNCDYNTQTIHLNWQIILSPLEVVDYVVVHELCHLTVPSHSKRFWKRVAKFMPDYKVYRKWLKDNHLDMMLP